MIPCVSTFDTCCIFSETVEFGGFQYLMVNSMKRWQLAEDHCRTLDSHLTSVATVEEASFLARFSTQEYNQCDLTGSVNTTCILSYCGFCSPQTDLTCIERQLSYFFLPVVKMLSLQRQEVFFSFFFSFCNKLL